MKFGIDAKYLLQKRTGITNYVRGLIDGLSQIDQTNEYILYQNSIEAEEKQSSYPANFRIKTIRSLPIVWKQWAVPRDIEKERLDLFHSPTSTIPMVRKCPTVVTIFDLFTKINPSWFPAKVTIPLNILTGYAARHADLIITISESTKNDIIKYYNVLPEKIKVTYLAKDDVYSPIDDEEALRSIRSKYNIKKDFILYVGSLFLFRNIPALLKAFSVLVHEKGVDVNLVLVGRQFWQQFDLRELIDKLDIQEHVIYLGYAPYNDLPLLYNAAEAFVYPSLYEGFGIPPLEAMACGTPVITSNIASLPEVVGDAGILINPYSIDSLVEGLYRVLIDKDLQKELRRKGIERSKLFTWDKTAQATLEAYKQIV